MKFFLINLIYFVVSFLIVFLIYILFVNRKLKKNKKSTTLELNYLIKRFNLNPKKEDYKKLIMIITLINSFIISFTSVITFNIGSLLWRIFIGFALLMTLIYSLYEIAGRILKRKESKNEL